MSSILVINSGSSSIKFTIIQPETGYRQLKGVVEELYSDQARMQYNDQQGDKHSQNVSNADHASALNAIWQLINQKKLDGPIVGVGHRVVHGGERFSQSVKVDQPVIDYLEHISYLAPLHNPSNVACIKALKSIKPEWPQVAVFDTAFHQTLSKTAYLYPILYTIYETYGIRRYGFHGTSHRYVNELAHQTLKLDENDSGFITAHLGNGCSLSAIKNGKSIDTTMGLTPLEGLMMGTRSGSIDPEIALFLQAQAGYSTAEVSHLLNKKSGLYGVSELTNDMRQLWEAADNGHKNAHLAIDMFCYRLVKAIASLMPLLPTFNGLIFTGGIGENDERVRARVLNGLKPLGFNLNAQANEKQNKNYPAKITEKGQPAYIIPTDEEWLIAQDTQQLI